MRLVPETLGKFGDLRRFLVRVEPLKTEEEVRASYLAQIEQLETERSLTRAIYSKFPGHQINPHWNPDRDLSRLGLQILMLQALGPMQPRSLVVLNGLVRRPWSMKPLTLTENSTKPQLPQ